MLPEKYQPNRPSGSGGKRHLNGIPYIRSAGILNLKLSPF